MFKLENFVDHASLRSKDKDELHTLFADNPKTKVWCRPGHLLLGYGQYSLDNLKCFDTLSLSDSRYSRQKRSLYSLKLTSLPSPIVDLVFPTCCSNPIIWVILQNGTVYIWCHTRSIDEGPKWTPTGQFFLSPTSDLPNVIVECVFLHVKCRTLYWSEVTNGSRDVEIKKLALPNDVANVKGNSDLMPSFGIVKNCPSCKLYSIDDTVFIFFKSPCPSDVFCTWSNPNNLRIYKQNFINNKCKLLWSSDFLFSAPNFKEISLTFAKDWVQISTDKKSNNDFKCIEMRNECLMIVMSSGRVVNLSSSCAVTSVCLVSNVGHIKDSFFYLGMLCMVKYNRLFLYNLRCKGELVEEIQVPLPVKTIWKHICCIQKSGIACVNGDIYQLVSKSPMSLYESNSPHSPQILDCIGQNVLAFLKRLHGLTVDGEADSLNVQGILDGLERKGGFDNDVVLVLVKQITKEKEIHVNSGNELKKSRIKKSNLEEMLAPLVDLYVDLENCEKQLLEL